MDGVENVFESQDNLKKNLMKDRMNPIRDSEKTLFKSKEKNLKNSQLVSLLRQKNFKGFTKTKALMDLKSGKVDVILPNKYSNSSKIKIIRSKTLSTKSSLSCGNIQPFLKVKNYQEDYRKYYKEIFANEKQTSLEIKNTFLTDHFVIKPNLSIKFQQDDKYKRIFRQIYGENYEDAENYTSLEFVALEKNNSIKLKSLNENKKLEKEIEEQIRSINNYISDNENNFEDNEQKIFENVCLKK
jgi:hypothetical protein